MNKYRKIESLFRFGEVKLDINTSDDNMGGII